MGAKRLTSTLDFDPEDLDRGADSSDEEADKQADLNAGREHYQAVGLVGSRTDLQLAKLLMSKIRKGKLRKQEPVTLGKQYAGARVSRVALDADSDDDPFAARVDDDQSSVEDEESGEEVEDEHDGVEASGSEVFDMNSEGSESAGSPEESNDEESDGEEVDGTDEDDEEDEFDDVSSDVDESAAPRRVSKESTNGIRNSGHGTKQVAGDDREELRRLMASDQKTIAATISEAAKADAAKGKAVKEQRTTFDALLNTRIKLQKGLSAINEMPVAVDGEKDAAGGDESEAADKEAIKSAESAALALWSTLEELRSALADAHSKDETKKRKRPSPVNPTTTTSTLWERMSDLESESLAHRRSVLDKWSSKVRGTSTSLPNARGKLLGSASGQQSITAVLDAHVATELGDRSSKRARQSGPTNGTSSAYNAEPVYDDTAFYQSLLRDLVEQRMSSEAITGGLDTLSQLPSRLPIHPVTGMRNDKVKRDVDTRASKGRKMRFNVHEKLQNFMAPEDRGSWTIRARNEFFASLLGKTASGLLGEGDESDSDVESDHDREEGGLRLFRN